MSNTFFERMKDLSQYNKDTKTIAYLDDTQSRWNGVYSRLSAGDYGIFITDKKQKVAVLIGKVSSINKGKSIECKDVVELACSNDDLLRVQSIYPEKISQLKGSFQTFIHPVENLDIKLVIKDIEEKKFINFYVSTSEAIYKLLSDLKENDRVAVIDKHGKLGNLKVVNASNKLVDFNEVKINVTDMTLDDMQNAHKSRKRKSVRSYNITRIEEITHTVSSQGYFKFETFFAYYDSLINKTVYIKKNTNVIKKIFLNPGEAIYKISISATYIGDKYFEELSENNLIVVNNDTRAKGNSNSSQGDVFSKQMKEGDYFYLCRGNSGMELIGRITGEAEECEITELAQSNWIQRSYEIVSEAVKEGSFDGTSSWWTPNNNSTCIKIPVREIEKANKELFKPFFNAEFLLEENMTTTNEPLVYNQILHGAPGTGKTYMAKEIAAKIVGPATGFTTEEEIEKYIKFVQFHPSYDYTDFVEGLRPIKKDNSVDITFELTPGIFKKFCLEAAESERKKEDKKFVFIIDEINRGEISKIFGELFFSIDPDYRGEKGKVLTQYSNILPETEKTFFVPKNVFIIGTMNDIDRSVESFDFAMRRRFKWVEISSEESATNMNLPPESVARMRNLNNAIENIDGLGTSYHVGGAYFLKLAEVNDNYSLLWRYHLEPLLKEYLRAMPDIKENLVKLKNAFENSLEQPENA